MVETRLLGLVVVAAIPGALAGASLLLHLEPLHPLLAVDDEYGRNIYASTCDSLLRSYLESIVGAVIAVAVPMLVAGFAAASGGRAWRVLAAAAARILDPVPLVLWLALVYSGLGAAGFAGRQIALTIVALPFVLGILLDRLGEVSALPFVRNARACGVGLPRRLIVLIIPNSISSCYFPVVVMFGLSLTFDAVLGLMGLANRSDLSLGTLLWRARERMAIDDRLWVLALLALLVTVALFAGLRWLLAERAREAIGSGPAVAADHA